MSLSLRWRFKRWLTKRLLHDIYEVSVNGDTGFAVLLKGPEHGGVAIGVQVNRICLHRNNQPYSVIYQKEEPK